MTFHNLNQQQQNTQFMYNYENRSFPKSIFFNTFTKFHNINFCLIRICVKAKYKISILSKDEKKSG